MVIIRTSATEASIQAVSPEFGVHFSRTGGLAVPSHAGGAASAAGAAAGAAGAGVGACASEAFTNAKLSKAARRKPQARAMSPARGDFRKVMVWLLSIEEGAGSKRRLVGFAGADAHRVLETEHEDLAVADLAGLGRAGDGFGDFVDLVSGDRDFDLELGQEAHGIFGAPIDFGMALLAAIPLDFSDGQPVADLVELEWLDDGHDEFHENPPLGPVHATGDRATIGLGRGRCSHPGIAPRGSVESSAVPTRSRQVYRLGKNDSFDRPGIRTAAWGAAQRSTKFAQKMVSGRDAMCRRPRKSEVERWQLPDYSASASVSPVRMRT